MLLLPGDRVDLTADQVPGPFLYQKDGHCYATIIGTVTGTSDPASGNTLVTINPVSGKRRNRSAVPLPGQLVIGLVSKVNPRFAGVDVIGVVYASDACKSSPEQIAFTSLPFPYKATIRQQDIYAVEERETAVLYDCFHPTDIVKARVIGNGDTSTGLLLSTGQSPDLGVVKGKSLSGGELRPAAWNEMVCSLTGAREKRKCAKPSI